VIETLRKYDMFPRYLDTAAYTKAVEELHKAEATALTGLGLLKKD
jgi:hypothetical protein